LGQALLLLADGQNPLRYRGSSLALNVYRRPYRVIIACGSVNYPSDSFAASSPDKGSLIRHTAAERRMVRAICRRSHYGP